MPCERSGCQRVYTGAAAATTATAYATVVDSSVQFVGLWTCGHMLSKKALDATTDAPDAAADGDSAVAASDGDQGHMKTAGGGSCPVCGVAFAAADIIPILPAEADREIRRR